MELIPLRPVRDEKGRCRCEACGALLVRMWDEPQRFCAMCGRPVDWTDERTVAQRIREALERSRKNHAWQTTIETRDAEAVLEMLESGENG